MFPDKSYYMVTSFYVKGGVYAWQQSHRVTGEGCEVCLMFPFGFKQSSLSICGN